MLYYRWLLIDDMSIPELQRVILVSSIVNWLGEGNTHKAIDLILEYLNRAVKIEIKCYKNLTYDINFTFNRVYTTNLIVRTLCSKLEYVFGEDMLGTHSTANTSSNIFSRA